MLPPFTDTREKPHISVFLTEDYKSLQKNFYCVVCGFCAFQYYDHVRLMVPYEGPITVALKPRYVIQCKNGKCKATYYVY